MPPLVNQAGCLMFIRILLTAMFLLGAASCFATDSVIIDDFENGLNPDWQATHFKGETRYRVSTDTSGKILQAVSKAAASGLTLEVDYNLQDYPILSWRWKVERIIAAGDATRKSGDDYAARVYVVFPHWFFAKTRIINYIWANKLPQGQVLPSLYMNNARMVALESGPGKVGRWVSERVDVYADYKRIFGEEPPAVGAIAIMTDTDNTGETAVAYYDDIRREQR